MSDTIVIDFSFDIFTNLQYRQQQEYRLETKIINPKYVHIDIEDNPDPDGLFTLFNKYARVEYDFSVETNYIRDIEINNDVYTKIMLEGYKSLFIWNKAKNKVIEIAAYHNMNNFPILGKSVQFISNGDTYYIPIDYVGNEYDTGLRYFDGDLIYQICSQIDFNIIVYKFTSANYFIYGDSLAYMYESLAYVFGINRVKLLNGCIKVRCPERGSGITQILFLGYDWIIELDNGLTLYSNINGNPSYSDTTDDEVGIIDRALLLKLNGQRTFTIRINSDTTQHEQLDRTRNYMILGTLVEKLPEKSSTYDAIAKSESYCYYEPKLGKAKSVSRLRYNYNVTPEYQYFKELLETYVLLKYNYYVLTELDGIHNKVTFTDEVD